MIITQTATVDEGGMPATILVQLADLMDAHPWWRHRCRLVTSVLATADLKPPARVLDVGCGSGLTLRALEAARYVVVGVDAVRPLLERLDRPERTLVHADITRGLPGALGKFDSALLLDVIEHLDDEVAVLRAVADYVEPNGILVVSVPARQDLYSAFDAVQGHRRRYSAESLLAVLTRAEWTPERLMWWGGWMVPIFRLRQRRPQQSDLAPHLQYRSFLKLPPRPFRWALELAFRLDHFATLGGLNPTGTSLIAVARKRVSCPT